MCAGATRIYNSFPFAFSIHHTILPSPENVNTSRVPNPRPTIIVFSALLLLCTTSAKPQRTALHTRPCNILKRRNPAPLKLARRLLLYGANIYPTVLLRLLSIGHHCNLRAVTYIFQIWLCVLVDTLIASVCDPYRRSCRSFCIVFHCVFNPTEFRPCIVRCNLS